MVSDGDSNAFRCLISQNLYPVQKLECINHVSKRLGKAIRLLKNCGGHGHGRLTQKTMKKLQLYYSNAVRILYYIYIIYM